MEGCVPPFPADRIQKYPIPARPIGKATRITYGHILQGFQIQTIYSGCVANISMFKLRILPNHNNKIFVLLLLTDIYNNLEAHDLRQQPTGLPMRVRKHNLPRLYVDFIFACSSSTAMSRLTISALYFGFVSSSVQGLLSARTSGRGRYPLAQLVYDPY